MSELGIRGDTDDLSSDGLKLGESSVESEDLGWTDDWCLSLVTIVTFCQVEIEKGIHTGEVHGVEDEDGPKYPSDVSLRSTSERQNQRREQREWDGTYTNHLPW